MIRERSSALEVRTSATSEGRGGCCDGVSGSSHAWRFCCLHRGRASMVAARVSAMVCQLHSPPSLQFLRCYSFAATTVLFSLSLPLPKIAEN